MLTTFPLLHREFFGKEPQRTMNAKECVSRGCSLQCAMLSPIFRVKEFSVEEAVPYTVNFTWEKEPGETTTSAVFKRGNTIPSTKMLTFYKASLFPWYLFILRSLCCSGGSLSFGLTRTLCTSWCQRLCDTPCFPPHVQPQPLPISLRVW